MQVAAQRGLVAQQVEIVIGDSGGDRKIVTLGQPDMGTHPALRQRAFPGVVALVRVVPALLPAQASEARLHFRLHRPIPGNRRALPLQWRFMQRRSAVRDTLEYWLALAVVASLAYTPLPVANWLARRYAGLLDMALPRLRQVAKRNLEFAMPEADAPRIIDAGFASIARVLVAFARFPAIQRNNIHQWIRCEGAEHFEQALLAGRGVLFATAHLGNWELSAFAHAILTGPMNV